MAGGEVLGWGEHGEGLVGADGVVGAFPVAGGAGGGPRGGGGEGGGGGPLAPRWAGGDGERGGGVGGDGGSGKAADHVHGAELLHEITPKAQVDGIDLDEVAGAQGDVARGLARGMRAEPASTLGGGTVEARLLELPAPLEVAQDAANARKGELEAQSTQEHLELELAPAHVLFALLTDGHDLRRRPRPSPRPTGAAGPVFERG